MNFTISKSIKDVNTAKAYRAVKAKSQCQQMNAWMQADNKQKTFAELHPTA